jgi:hypothetical protein
MRTALAVLAMLSLALLVYAGMWRGWRGRGHRQADIPPLHPVEPGAAVDGVLRTAEGRYFATTTQGSWMDRVVVHGLGVRSPCTLRLTDTAVDVLREPHSFRIARADLLAARRDRGTAGKVVPPDGVLVLTWRHPGAAAGPDVAQHVLESGFRLAHAGEHDAWVAAITALTSPPDTAPSSSGTTAQEADR